MQGRRLPAFLCIVLCKTNMFWTVYDMDADDIIGIWPLYEDCILYCRDNQEPKDNWEIFPEFEVIQPVGA